MSDFFELRGSLEAKTIDQKIMNGQIYYFVRIAFIDKRDEIHDCDYILGWLHEDALVK